MISKMAEQGSAVCELFYKIKCVWIITLSLHSDDMQCRPKNISTLALLFSLKNEKMNINNFWFSSSSDCNRIPSSSSWSYLWCWSRDSTIINCYQTGGGLDYINHTCALWICLGNLWMGHMIDTASAILHIFCQDGIYKLP